jgi:Dyp-type peroxidase family
MGASSLQLHDIQGNVLQAYNLPVGAYVFVRISRPQAGHALLRAVTPGVTSAQDWRGRVSDSTLNVAVTATGLVALDVGRRALDSFPPEFLQGMARRAERWLGDSGPSHPRTWERGLGSGCAHLLLTINARSHAALRDRLALLRGEMGRIPGVAVCHEQHAAALPSGRDYGREHFGYDDGFAQPSVRGGPVPARPGLGIRTRRGWRAVKPGEFILGHADEDGVLPDAPSPPLGRNGTFMVYRKLRQDVARYREVVEAAARDHFDGDAELVAAKIVGRWRDGTPLALATRRSDPALAADPRRANDFTFRGDPRGERCPLGAHIRRANPRDALPGGFARTRRHRIIRRGMPYGPVLPPGTDDDGADRGLVFVCFNASIRRQFETVNGWLTDGNAFRLGGESDYLIGANERTDGKLTIQGQPPVLLAPQWPLVVTRGGEYLFLPSLTALYALGRPDACAEVRG